MGDRWEIEQLVLRVARCADRPDVGSLVDHFTADAVLAVGGRRVQGREAIREFFGGTTAMPAEGERTKHVVTNTLVDTDGDAFVATSYWQLLRHWGLANWGRYIDRIVRDGDTWRIAHRSVLVDGQLGRPSGD